MEIENILFRAKRIDNGEWVEGFYTLLSDNNGMKPTIITGTEKGCFIPEFIDPKTVSQCTGRDGIDSEGKKVKIFENQFVKCDDGFIRLVCWVQEEGCFKLRCPNSWVDGKYVYFDPLYLNESTKLILVGNVFDNNFDEHNLKLHNAIEESGY